MNRRSVDRIRTDVCTLALRIWCRCSTLFLRGRWSGSPQAEAMAAYSFHFFFSRGGGGGGVTPWASITSLMAEIVGTDGLKFPGRKPCAMMSGVQPYLFF